METGETNTTSDAITANIDGSTGRGRGPVPCGKSGSASLRRPSRKLLLGAALTSSKNCPAGQLPGLASARSWPRVFPLPPQGSG